MTSDEYYEKKIKEKIGLSLEKINNMHSTEIEEEIEKKIDLKNEPLSHRYFFLEGKRGTSEHQLYKYYTEKEKNERKQLLIEYSG